MDTPNLVANPPLFPHADLFSHATNDLVDTGIEMFTLDNRHQPVANRMYLSLQTAEQVALLYGKTMRELPTMEHAEAALASLAANDLYDAAIAENRALRSAIMAMARARLMPRAAADALEKALGKNFTADELALVRSLKQIGV